MSGTTMTPGPFGSRRSLRLVGVTSLSFVLADLAALTLAFVASVLVRYELGGEFHPTLYWSLWPVLGLFVLSYAGLGMYPGVLLPPAEVLKRSFLGTSLIFLALGAFTFMAREAILYSRLIFLWAWLASAILVPLFRALVRRWLGRYPWWGYPALILAEPEAAAGLIQTLRGSERSSPMGLKPALVAAIQPPADGSVAGVPAIALDEFLAKLPRLACDYAIVALPEGQSRQISAMVERLSHHVHKIILVPEIMVASSLWATSVDLRGTLGLELRQKLIDPHRRILKRLLDLTLTCLGLILLAPVFAAIAIAIKLESPGPVFYRQERIGVDGRTIRIHKFRTMVADADAALQRHLDACPEAMAEWCADQKLRVDPRRTRVGRILRPYSLDELPQLLDVLRGELSLVGPRPIIQEEISRYGEAFAVYRRVRPGITGLWQVSGRNNLTYAQRVALDCYYIRNWSVWLDIYILAKTIPVVLSGEGAY